MEQKRGFGVWKTFTILVLGNIAAVLALSGQSLDCTNDLEKVMSCQFGGEKCAEYSMTLRKSEYRDMGCVFKQCSNKTCCCTVEMTYIVSGHTFNATVWKEGKSIETKEISIADTIKPKTPTILSVTETNGNFKVVWLTNTRELISESLTAVVTYREKGGTQKVSYNVSQTPADERNYYELQDLKPSTTYLVSVKSYTHWSKMYSDSSKEFEFTTPVSSNTVFMVIIISLSVTAVIITAAIFGCYVKLKTKWWDSVAKYPNPKLLVVRASEPMFKPMPPVISPVCVEPLLDDGKQWLKESLKDSSSGSLQQSSGINTGSSCLSYANTEPVKIIAEVQEALSKIFTNIGPVSPSTTVLPTELEKGGISPHDIEFMAEDMNSGSFGLVNKTYSILLPNFPSQSTTEVHMESKMLCDSDYHPSEGVTVISTYQMTPACPLITLPPDAPSLMPTDMSYQPCNADSGTVSFAEDSGLSSISSDTNTAALCDLVPQVEPACESSAKGNTEQVIVCDENPCYGSMPTGSHSFPAVDFDYQPFQSLAVEQPGVLFSGDKSCEKEENFGTHSEECVPCPAVTCPMNNDQCLPALQRPFLSLISTNKSAPMITESGYQCV